MSSSENNSTANSTSKNASWISRLGMRARVPETHDPSISFPAPARQPEILYELPRIQMGMPARQQGQASHGPSISFAAPARQPDILAETPKLAEMAVPSRQQGHALFPDDNLFAAMPARQPKLVAHPSPIVNIIHDPSISFPAPVPARQPEILYELPRIQMGMPARQQGQASHGPSISFPAPARQPDILSDPIPAREPSWPMVVFPNSAREIQFPNSPTNALAESLPGRQPLMLISPPPPPKLVIAEKFIPAREKIHHNNTITSSNTTYGRNTITGNTTTGNFTTGNFTTGNFTTGNWICWYGNATEGNATGNITCRRMGAATQLFGIASFCNSTTALSCANIPIRECPSCSMEEASLFLAFVLLLGMMILIGNLYVLWTLYEEKNKQKLTYIKSSMAVADVLNGVNLLATVAPSVFWTLDLTVKELDKIQLEMTNAPRSKARATYFLFVNTSATYQVTLLSLIQLYVITRPLESRNLSVNKVLLMIGFTWLGALLCSTMPSWMPDSFEYTYQHYLFLYSYALLWNAPKYKYLAIVLLRTWIPYTTMAIATLVMYISVRKQLKKSQSLAQNNKQIAKKERNITKTVLYMELGFAITTVPYVVMSIILNETDRKYNKDLKLKLTMIFIYLYLSRSLVNVFVYLIREKAFRRSITRRFSIRSSTFKYTSTSTSTRSQTTLPTTV